jgi:terminase small subunit-like protein
MAHPGGRPSIFNKELGDTICRRIMNGESLRGICEAKGMPDRTTVHDWLSRDREFANQYAYARENQADTLADDLLYIADTAKDPHIARLRIDTRKWIASKLKPKKYGDKIDHTTNGKDLPTPILGGMSAKDTTDDIT